MTTRHRAWVVADTPALTTLDLGSMCAAVDPVFVNVDPTTELALRIELGLRNVGPTPALDLKVQHCLRLAQEFHSAPQHEVTTRLGSLGPSMSRTISEELDPPSTDIGPFQKLDLKLFFSGTVTYADVFRHTHSTSWAFQYDLVVEEFVRCSFHNEMLDWAPPEDLAE